MSTLNYLDDSDWSIDIEDEPTRLWIPLTAAILGAVLLAGSWAYRHYQCGPKDWLPEYQTCSFVWDTTKAAR